MATVFRVTKSAVSPHLVRLVIRSWTTIVGLILLGLGICPPLQAQCVGDFDCKQGRACRNGICFTPDTTVSEQASKEPFTKCTKDTDCKGDGICQGGQCTSPQIPPANARSRVGPCVKDTDCKGDRVCNSGACELPPSETLTETDERRAGTPLPASAGPPADSAAEQLARFEPLLPLRRYAAVSSVTAAHTWAAVRAQDGPSAKATGTAAAGVRISAHAILGHGFHLGAYGMLRGGTLDIAGPSWDSGTVQNRPPGGTTGIVGVSTGASVRWGRRIMSKILAGFSFSAGIAVQKMRDWQKIDALDKTAFWGPELHPAAHVHIGAIARGRYRLGFPISIGALILPLSRLTAINSGGESLVLKQTSITPVITVGIAIGL